MRDDTWGERGLAPVDEGGRGGDLEPVRDPIGMTANPVEFVPRAFDPPAAWRLLSPGTRDWAMSVAGAGLPRSAGGVASGQVAHSWSVKVYLADIPTGPGWAPGGATCTFWVLGRSGLAFGSGTTSRLVREPEGATRWVIERRRVALDPVATGQVRTFSGPATSATSGSPPGSPAHAAGLDVAAVVPEGVVRRTFSNLPPAAQDHITAPFRSSGRPAPYGDVDPTSRVERGRYQESQCGFLASGRWVAAWEAVRSVPYRSGLDGAALWNHSPEASEIQSAPWSVVAWIAPVLAPGSDVMPR